MKNEEMALLFSEATPYIQKYHGKTLVIKYGGNAMVNDELKLAVMNDLVTLTLLGVRVWDYRAEWADIAGFVCPKYTVLWYLLCLWLLSCLRLARTLPQRLPQPAAEF